MAEWEGIVKATAPKYLMGAQDLTIRGRLLLSLMRKYDRLRFNESGTLVYWDVQMAEQPVESYGDAGLINFEPHDLLSQLTLDWRGYYASDKLTEKQKEMNKGDVAIVNYYDRKIPTLVQSITNKFGNEMLLDGNLAANANRLHGIESFLGSGTVVVGDLIAKPSDTYAGKATDLGDTIDAYRPWGAHLGPDGTTLYFTGSRTTKASWPRSRAEAERDLARAREWDNGVDHIYGVSLQPWLHQHHARS